MGESADRSRALDEANRWFTQLKRPSITTEALYEFREWRKDEANAAAFAKVERMWETAGTLSGRPAIRAATEAALAARPPRPAGGRSRIGWRPLGVALASLAVVASGGVIAANQMQPTYETSVGGQRLEVLKDGSRVRLNTDSKIRVRFGGGVRRVELIRGQAFFEAAHDPSRPFVVEADGAEVQALGTKFDVRRAGSAIQVTLVEGRVQVRLDDKPATATLKPNQSLTVTADGISAPRTTNAAEAVGWTTGRLTFRGVPLQAAIDEVNRYSRRKIVLTDDGDLAKEPVSGIFEPGDTASFVAAVDAVFGLRVVSETPGEIRLAPRAPPAL